MPLDPSDTFGEYRRLILSELERLSSSVQDLTHQINQLRASDLAEIRSEIGMLKVKAGVWGLLGGLIPVLAALAALLLKAK